MADTVCTYAIAIQICMKLASSVRWILILFTVIWGVCLLHCPPLCPNFKKLPHLLKKKMRKNYKHLKHFYYSASGIKLDTAVLFLPLDGFFWKSKYCFTGWSCFFIFFRYSGKLGKVWIPDNIAYFGNEVFQAWCNANITRAYLVSFRVRFKWFLLNCRGNIKLRFRWMRWNVDSSKRGNSWKN